MKHEKLIDALDEIRDEYIAEAVQKKKRHTWRWVGAVAAVLAVAITATALMRPGLKVETQDTAAKEEVAEQNSAKPSPMTPSILAKMAVAQPEYPEMVACPANTSLMSDYWDAYDQWQMGLRAQYDQPKGYADNLTGFYQQSIPVFLTGEGNRVYSPANVYMALAMLAETTGGDTRQEILTTLNAQSMEELRQQAGYLWNAHYCDDKLTTLLLANSLWLDDSLDYKAETAATLARDYYASVYRGSLGSQEANLALRTWLNENTGNLLQEQAAQLELEPGTLMSLASTIYYKVKWDASFQKDRSQEGIFHGPGGEQTVTYMYSTICSGEYHYGQDYTAVAVAMEDGARMWLILPDEGCTPQDILNSGHALQDLLGPNPSGDSAQLDIRLQLPKFDVASQTQLRQGLQALGLSQVFDPTQADFSGITDSRLFLSQADHAARVKIDEEGMEAAAYTVLQLPASGPPLELEEIDFVLDRPFLFLIESQSGVPLFTGVVNQP